MNEFLNNKSEINQTENIDLAKNEAADQSEEAKAEANSVEEPVEYIPPMEAFEAELYNGLRKLYLGDIVEGTVISVTEKEILVNIDYISDGVIPITETLANEDEDLQTLYHEGDAIKAEIIKTDDGDGNVLLSIKKANEVLVWDELEEAHQSGMKINVKVHGAVKGGVVCLIKGLRAFIPASQLSTRYVEDLNDFIGVEFFVKVIEFNKEDKKVILSRKEVEIQENALQKSMLMETLKKGDKFAGKVVKLTNFGAFVDIGGAQGLIHNQDLSWERVKHPSEVVKEGDQVEVYVIDVDRKAEKIALGLKNIKEDPWGDVSKTYKVGDILTGEVVRLSTYGAFINIGNGLEGLVHISEMSEKRISRPQEVVSLGDQVQVKILNIDLETRRIQLSMKSVEGEFNSEELERYKTSEEATTSLEDVFKVFLKDIKN